MTGEAQFTTDVLIGTTVSPTANGGKVLVFGDNTADPTMGADVAGLFAKDVTGTVEMFAVDEADNATQISPHDPVTGEWYFYSENRTRGRYVKIRTEQFIRDALDKITELAEAVGLSGMDVASYIEEGRLAVAA